MTVHFIGAGPGDPELITVRGLRLIESCKLCLYAGSLVPEAVVAAAPAEVRTGHHVVDQRPDVPGRPDVPFHVRIVYEEFAIAVQGKVDRVAVAHVQDSRSLPSGLTLRTQPPGALPLPL